jgi:hypothetical protein
MGLFKRELRPTVVNVLDQWLGTEPTTSKLVAHVKVYPSQSTSIEQLAHAVIIQVPSAS